MCVPATGSEWPPTSQFVRSLAQHLQIDRVHICSGEAQPQFWDLDINPEEHVTVSSREPIFFASDLTLEEALQKWTSTKPLVTHFMFSPTDWANRLNSQILEQIPEETTKDFQLTDLSILIGPWSIPDDAQQDTKAKGHFNFSVNGYGWPRKPKAFIEAFTGLPIVCDLTEWLVNKTFMPWKWIYEIS